MSWLQTLDTGVWNAWILMLYYPLHPLLMIAVDKAVGTGEIFNKMGDVPYDKRERRDFVISMVITLFLLAYSIILPLKLWTLWFFVGFTIYLVGLVMLLTAIVNVATTPPGQPFITGMYHFSRHPIYSAMWITFLGVSIATASWIFFLLTVVIMPLYFSQAIAEERCCLKNFGNEYQEYMDRTPRWIGKPKSG
jgi:protein-S-isoprenylcysteine O-methyltransferase Ste14